MKYKYTRYHIKRIILDPFKFDVIVRYISLVFQLSILNIKFNN